MIAQLWKKIAELGITPATDQNTKVKIFVMNQVIALVILFSLASIPIYLLINFRLMLVGAILCILIFSFGLFLNSLQKTTFTFHYFINVTHFLLLYFAYEYPAPSNFYIFIFSNIVLIYFIFSERRTLRIYNIITFFTLAILLTLSYGISELSDLNNSSTVYIYFAFIAFFIEIAVLGFYKKQMEVYINTIITNKKLLSEAQDLAEISSWNYNYKTDKLIFSENISNVLGNVVEKDIGFNTFLKQWIDKQYHEKILNFKRDISKKTQLEILYSHTLGNKLRWLELKIQKVYDTNYETSQLIGTLQDRTIRKQNADKLAYSVSILEATIDATNDGLLVVNTKGEIINYNKRFAELWETPDELTFLKNPQKAISHGIKLLINPNSLREKIRELRKDLSATSFDTFHLKNGKIYEGYSHPQYLGEEIVGRVWSFRDITEQEKTKQALEKSNSELKRSNKELEQFAYLSSHDLQEPLRMVGNFVELLEMEYGDKLGNEGKKYVKYAVNGVQRMSSLIDDLLEYSKVGKNEGQKKLVDIEKLINSKLLDLFARIQEQEAQIVLKDLPHELLCVSNQIGIVFFNLINNGLKFNNKKEPKVTIAAKEQMDSWLFSVQDNGLGIAASNKEKVFEIFKRLHRKEEYQGTGMGLSFCKRIVEQHGGKIWLESELGIGTTFFFTIPK